MKYLKKFSINESVDVTTDELSLHKYNLDEPYGTPCGQSPENYTALCHPIIIEFIDVFFGGVLDNVEVYKEGNHKLIEGGVPILKKLTITNEEFEHFVANIKDSYYYKPMTRKKVIDTLSEFLDIKRPKFEDVENKIDKEKHPQIICYLFSFLVESFGGSFRCDYLNDGRVDLESE